MIFGVVALASVSATAALIPEHWANAANNLTTIEAHYQNTRGSNPFDLGSTVANLEECTFAANAQWLKHINIEKQSENINSKMNRYEI